MNGFGNKSFEKIGCFVKSFGFFVSLCDIPKKFFFKIILHNKKLRLLGPSGNVTSKMTMNRISVT